MTLNTKCKDYLHDIYAYFYDYEGKYDTDTCERTGMGRTSTLTRVPAGSRPLKMSVNESERRAGGPTLTKSHLLLMKPTKKRVYH